MAFKSADPFVSPSLGSRNALRLFRAPPDKQVYVKGFVSKFMKWSEWQRKIVLCGITERCTKQLLNVLTTAMLPFYHKKRKRRSLRSTKKKRLANRTLTMDPEKEMTETQKCDEFENHHSNTQKPQDPDRSKYISENTLMVSQTEKYDTNLNPFMPAFSENGIDIARDNSKDDNFDSNSSRQPSRSGDCSCRQEPENFIQKDSSINCTCDQQSEASIDIHALPDRSEYHPDDENRVENYSLVSGSEKVSSGQADLSSSGQGGKTFSANQLSTVHSIGVTIQSGSGANKNKAKGSINDISSLKKTSVLGSSSRDHIHEIPKIGKVISSKLLLPPIPRTKLEKLGPFMIANKPNNKLNIHTVKNKQWWLPSTDSFCYIKPSRSKLLEAFKEDVNELWRVFVFWKNAEKGDCILEICSQCTSVELQYFGECVRQRMKESCDIQRLADDILLKVFGFLDLTSIKAVKQVCKRWHELANADALWKSIVFQKANELDLLEYLESEILAERWAGKSWKDIYLHLLDISKDLKSLKQLQHDSEIDNAKNITAEKECLDDELLIELPEAGFRRSSSKSEESIRDLITSSLHITRKTDFSKGSAFSGNGKTDPFSNSEEEQPVDPYDENMEKFLGGTLAIVENNLKIVTSINSDIDDNEDVMDIRDKPVQARNELGNANKLKETEDSMNELAVVTVPGVKPLRSVKKLKGHYEGVTAIDSDTKRVMTGSSDRTVRVWDARSGRKIARLEGHKGGVRAIRFDDKHIYTGSWDMAIIVWDVIKFVRMETLFGHTGCVSCLDMTDHILVSGSHDKTLIIWDKMTLKPVQRLSGHTDAINSITLQDEKNLFSGGADRTIRHWDVKLGVCRRVIRGCPDQINTIKLCGDLLSAGSGNGKITFWDKRTGACEATIQAHEMAVNAIQFVGSRFITAGSDAYIKEWDLSTCACLRTLRGHKGAVYCIKASKKRIVSGSEDNTSRIWFLENPGTQSGSPYGSTRSGDENTRVIESA